MPSCIHLQDKCSLYNENTPVVNKSHIQTTQQPCYNTMQSINQTNNSSSLCNNNNNNNNTNKQNGRITTSQNIQMTNDENNGNNETNGDETKKETEQQLSLVERLGKRIPGFGIVLAVMASFFLGSAGLLVKLTNSVHGIQVAVFR